MFSCYNGICVPVSDIYCYIALILERNTDFLCYIRGSIGRGREVIAELEKRGGRNVYDYGGNGDRATIYYINKDGFISTTTEDTEIGYLIVNSGWKELKLKEPKKERVYIISVKEGNDNCKKCPILEKCEDGQEWKCELAALLKTDKSLDGKTLTVVEMDPNEIPESIHTKINTAKML